MVDAVLRDKTRSEARNNCADSLSISRSSVMNKILRTLIWQLARANREYTKAAATVCEVNQPSLDTSRTANLWKTLVTDLSKSVDATAFVVIDGIDVIDVENDQSDLIDILKQVQTIINDRSSRLKVRILIAGTTQALDGVIESIKRDKSTTLAVPEINLEGNPQNEEPTMNQTDLALYAAERLNRTERLKGLDDQLKGRITRELAQGARGAYSRLTYLLDDLVNIQNTNQIEEVLQRANQSLRDIIASKVEALNISLSRDEIGEVNILLDWLTVAYSDLNILQCEAILSLKADGQSLGLEDRMKRKYSDIFSLNDAKQVTLRAGVEDYIASSSETSTNQLEVTRRSQIQAPEVNLVKKVLQAHFRHVFGDEDVYSRFAFEDFFQNKLGDQALRIRLVRLESLIKVAQGCLIVVCDKFNDERSSELMTYAYNWFAEHLGLVDLDNVDPVTKQDIGRKLTRVLREQALIESWWSVDRRYLTWDFVYGDYSLDLVKSIHTWLKDPNVQKGLTDMPADLEWVRSATSGDQPSTALYINVAKIMAKRWHDAEEELEWVSAFAWLCGYVTSVRWKIGSSDLTWLTTYRSRVIPWNLKIR